jgi:SAM-dependent methyltransferase
MEETYTHGHHESVLRSHRWRTAENSAGYLLGSLRPGLDLLDVGCGPGTITADLAGRLAPGRVVGLDRAPEVLAQARAGQEGENLEFLPGDVYRLPFGEASFDVVHAHQVLQHLTEPVGALGEMHRVLRPGGILAVRDSDYGAFGWTPADPLLDRWLALYHEVTARNGAEADAGRYLAGWVGAAGFVDIVVSDSSWTFDDQESRAWWGELWAERVELSGFGRQALDYGLSDGAELAALAGAWRRWAVQPDGSFEVPHTEVLARRPA